MGPTGPQFPAGCGDGGVEPRPSWPKDAGKWKGYPFGKTVLGSDPCAKDYFVGAWIAEGEWQAGKCSAFDGAKGKCVCKADPDCGKGEWCDGGLDPRVNACRAKLARGEKCEKAGSLGTDHTCKSGECSGFPKYVCRQGGR